MELWIAVVVDWVRSAAVPATELIRPVKFRATSVAALAPQRMTGECYRYVDVVVIEI